MKLALCGHRTERLPFSVDSESYYTLERMLWQAVSRYVDGGWNTFSCGATQGMGIALGEIIVTLKKPGFLKLNLVCVIPYREQARRWEDVWRLKYCSLLHDADSIIQVCDEYRKGCYQKQSRYIIDQCDALLAVYDGKGSGRTAYAVEYARKHGKPVEIINPFDAIVEEPKPTLSSYC